MGKQSQAWKDLERLVAEKLKGKRVSRGADFGKEDVDVVVEDFIHLRIDAKYRTKHAHHSLLENIRKKYCPDEHQIPVLVTRHHRQRGANVTIPIEAFADMLDAIRLYRDELCHLRQHQAELPRIHAVAVPKMLGQAETGPVVPGLDAGPGAGTSLDVAPWNARGEEGQVQAGMESPSFCERTVG